MAFIQKSKHYKTVFFICLLILFMIIIISCTLGVANITTLQSLKILVSKIPLLKNIISLHNIKSTYIKIVLEIRLPRILLAALVGCGLSVVGTAYQGMFKNPMADPYVLGISSGSAVGATIAIILGLESKIFGLGMITIFAFAGALLTIFLVYNISKIGNKIPIVTMLLAGIATSFFLSSVISLMMIFNREQIEKIVFWTMGSFAAASYNKVIILFPFTIIGMILIYMFSRDLNIMLTGDDTAKSLGIEVEKVRKIILVITSIMVAAAVSVSGIIGFVGLIIPHTIRLIVGPDHRVLIPFSALGGSIFMIVCDTLARTLIPPMEIPVGAITSVFGAPYFIYLLFKNKKKVL